MMNNYSIEKNLLRDFDKNYRKRAFKGNDLRSFVEWRENLIGELKELIGLNSMEDCSIKAHIIETEDCGTYIREKVAITTEPLVWMPMYILKPKNSKKEKLPVVIALHGHGSCGKEAVAGVTKEKEIKGAIEKYNYDYGVKFVEAGYVVFCPDARGAGERRERIKAEDSIFTTSCTDLSNAALAMGKTLTGMFAWDFIKLIDYIETLDYCDSKNIGLCGFSGGASMGMWVSILDSRIKATILSGYFHGFRETILKNNLCSCNFVPKLWSLVDMGDLVSLIAPRHVLIESGENDGLNGESGLNNVYPQLAIVKDAYKLYGCNDSVIHHTFKGAHMYNGAKSVAFLNRVLK